MCCRCRNVRSNAVGLPLNAPAPPHAPRDCARKQKDHDDPLPAAGQALHKCRRVGAGWFLQCYRRVCLVWRARTPAGSSHALPLPLPSHFALGGNWRGGKGGGRPLSPSLCSTLARLRGLSLQTSICTPKWRGGRCLNHNISSGLSLWAALPARAGDWGVPTPRTLMP